MRKLGALLLAGFLLAGLAGCSSKKSDTVTATGDDTTETTAETSRSEDSKSDDSRADKPSRSDSTDGGASAPDELDLGSFGNCLEVAGTYAGIHLSALGAGDEEAKAELQRSLDQIKGEVPPDIQDDLQVIADGVAKSKNLTELGEFWDSDEYKKANENVEKYLDEQCGTGR